MLHSCYHLENFNQNLCIEHLLKRIISTFSSYRCKHDSIAALKVCFVCCILIALQTFLIIIATFPFKNHTYVLIYLSRFLIYLILCTLSSNRNIVDMVKWYNAEVWEQSICVCACAVHTPSKNTVKQIKEMVNALIM